MAKKHSALILAALGAAVFAGIGWSIATAKDPTITRTEKLRSDLAGIAGKESVIYIADLDPGAAGGKHTHYGDEFVYVLDGEIIVEPVGQPALALKAGDTGHFTPDIVHAARNASDSVPAKVLVMLVVEKGKPLAEPAK